MAQFIEVQTKIGPMLVNLDTVDTIFNNARENHAVITFASDNENYVNTEETYEEIVSRIKIGDVYNGSK